VPAPEHGAPALILCGATIVTMDGARRVIPDGYLAVSRGRIVDLGPASSLSERERAEAVHLGGRALLPGFVNTHHHLHETLLRGVAEDQNLTVAWARDEAHWRALRATDEPACFAATLLACAELMRSGVTSTADSLLPWRGWRKSEGALRAAHDSGLRVVHCVAFIDRTEMIPREVQFSTDQARAHLDALREAFGHGLVAVEPEALSLPRASDGLIRALHAEASRTFAMHLTYSREFERWALDNLGRTAVEHLAGLGVVDRKLLGAHPVYLDDREIGLLAAGGARTAYCAVSNMLIGTGVAPLRPLLDAGVPVGLGLDFPNHGNNMFETMKFSVLAQKLLARDATVGSAALALELATIGGARALGMEDSIGSLEPGKWADVVVVDLRKVALQPAAGALDLLAFAGGPEVVESVMVQGRWVLRDGAVVAFDEPEAIRLANEAQHRVLEVAGRRPDPRVARGSAIDDRGVLD
jgi:5-methylthioadenosine/S-adenosylhomocysteine deaminase